jgi:hypothetical protein
VERELSCCCGYVGQLVLSPDAGLRAEGARLARFDAVKHIGVEGSQGILWWTHVALEHKQDVVCKGGMVFPLGAIETASFIIRHEYVARAVVEVSQEAAHADDSGAVAAKGPLGHLVFDGFLFVADHASESHCWHLSSWTVFKS